MSYLSAELESFLFDDKESFGDDNVDDLLRPVHGVRLDQGQRPFQDVVVVLHAVPIA